MQIDQIVCPRYIEEKLEVKHQVTVSESEKPMEEKNRLSSISKAGSYEEMGEFWDTHDFTDFDDPNVPDVEFEITCEI